MPIAEARGSRYHSAFLYSSRNIGLVSPMLDSRHFIGDESIAFYSDFSFRKHSSKVIFNNELVTALPAMGQLSKTDFVVYSPLQREIYFEYIFYFKYIFNKNCSDKLIVELIILIHCTSCQYNF